MNGLLPEWGRMSRAERDAAYNNSLAVPGSDAAQRLRLEASAAFRAAHPPREIAYGPHERQRIDVFGTGAKTLVFIHGGYWQRGARDWVSAVAEGPMAHGWSVAFPGYRLTPEVSVTEIVADVMAALDRLAELAPLVVAGHSAGGHLAAMALWHDSVIAGLAISGVFELGPVRDTYLNEKLSLTEAEVQTLSPLRLAAVSKPLAIAYGSIELPALIASSRDFHAMRAAAHAPGPLLPLPNAEHFSVLDALRDADGALCREVTRS